ncbi:YqaA family protein [Candidatus Marithrix sp. Canyon 246]|uniref:YqaA family protein n=1 Tax=Candidatus Marithrix sp. Canyon 246 TaxID=1827136 RepID=UPI0009F55CBF|nr:YqaA family protein [Candidatus Marithrix sp. Canyon 246]
MAIISTLFKMIEYLSLFIVSFLAATLLPLGSEIFVATMTISGYNAWLIFAIATTGNTLGSITNYYIGKLGANFILSRYIKVNSDKPQKTEQIYQKWGSPILFFAWIPIIGDPLTVVAGIFKLNLYIFIFWVALGKAFRYFVVIISC